MKGFGIKNLTMLAFWSARQTASSTLIRHFGQARSKRQPPLTGGGYCLLVMRPAVIRREGRGRSDVKIAFVWHGCCDLCVSDPNMLPIADGCVYFWSHTEREKKKRFLTCSFLTSTPNVVGG